jgi:beta-N-acetylhexosaminidase
VPHDRARLDDVELAPFRAAIAAGAPAIMSAHIVFSALDTFPATLSRAILTDLLRGELGFTGVIFTDALDMRAIADTYGKAEAAVLAKAAGADVLLPLGSLDEQIAVAEALCAAIETGRLAPESFTETAERLARLRMSYPMDGAAQDGTASDNHLERAAFDIVVRGVTAHNMGDTLPLAASTRLVLIDCLLPRFSRVEEATERAEQLREMITSAFPHANCYALQPGWDEQTEARVVAAARQGEAVLLVTRNAGFIEQQAQLAQRLAALGVPLVHAAVRNPDADVVTPGAATLHTYGDPPLSLRALVECVGKQRLS